MGIFAGIHLFSGALLAFIFVLVLLKKRWVYYTRPFLFFLLVILSGLTSAAFFSGGYSSLYAPANILLYFHVSFLPYAWLQLGNRWGRDISENNRRGKVLATVVLSASSLWFLFFVIMEYIDPSLIVSFKMIEGTDGGWLIDFGRLSLLISGYLIVGLTAGTYALEKCYRSSLGLARERIKKSFFPLLAFSIGLLILATIGMLYGEIHFDILILIFLITALAMLPVARHFLLFKPETDGVIITRKGSYSSIVVVIFGIYFLIVGGIGEFLVKYNFDDGMFFSVVILLLMLIIFFILVISQTFRSRLKKVTEATASRFAGNSPYVAEWKEFAEEVSVTLNLDAIYSRTARLIHRLLKINDSFFIIKEADPNGNLTLYCGDGIDRGISNRRLNLLIDWLYRSGHPVEVATLLEKAPREAKQLSDLNAEIPFEPFLLVPFIARQNLLGFWGIGRHSSGRNLSSEEIGFVEAAANPVSLTILAARMTDELIVSREIESFHRFSSFVLHDLKNSVGMLSMLLQNAGKNMGNPEFQQAALVTIQKAVERQRKLISRLTADKEDEKLSLEILRVSDIISEAVERLRLDTVKSVELEMNIKGSQTVHADREKLGSVLDNLMINALEAMPEGGRISISSVASGEKDMTGISVKDTGVGMDREFISTRLFKPFSSTKKYGLGIGMYQSREIILSHKGRLEVKSEVGQGSEFIVHLPGGEK